MASAPTERGDSGAVENAVDHALHHLIDADSDGALSWSAARVADQPDDVVAALLCARILGARGRTEAAVAGLRAVATLAIEAGNLAVAVAACCEQRALGEDAASQYAAVAAAFSRGSPRLAPRPAAPPAMGPPAAVTELPREGLIEAAEKALAKVRERAVASDPTQPVGPQLLFSSLDAVGLQAMIEVFEVSYVASGSVLIQQGTVGSEAFVVVRGELDVRREKDGEEFILLARLGAGALFGEMALLSRAPRAASVIASRPSIVLVATQAALDAVAEKQPQVGVEFAAHCRGRMVSNLVRTSSLFEAIDANERLSLMYRFVTRTYEKGQRLITQGQQTDGLHLIASGEVEVRYQDAEGETLHLADLSVGDVVGEMGLVLRRPANADVLAKVPTITLHLPRDGFFDLVKEHPAVLGQLYALAVRRDEETTSLVAQEASSAEDCLLL